MKLITRQLRDEVYNSACCTFYKKAESFTSHRFDFRYKPKIDNFNRRILHFILSEFI